MHLRSRPIKALVAALTAALALSSCSGNEPSQGSTKEALHLATYAAPTTFAVGLYGGGDVFIQKAIFDTVLGVDTDGKIVAGLAESWKYNDSLTQLTLTLREGVTFSNGEVLDAKAVAASLNASKNGAATSSQFTKVSTIEAKDARTVLITLAEPDGALVPNLSGVYGVVAAPSTLGTSTEATEPVGSGPYKMSSSESQIGSKYVLEKKDGYWNSSFYPFKRVEVSVISDPSALFNGLQSGQLDYANILPDQKGQLPESQFVTGVDNPSIYGAIWIADRGGELLPALKDVRVRQAINMAFDRESIEKNIAPGAIKATNQLANPRGGAYSKELAGKYPYSVEAARKLLAEAGYQNGFEVKMPSTIASAQFEPIITQSLADIGITVKWETVAIQDVVSKMIAKSYPMFYFPGAWQTADAQDVSNALGAVFNPFQTMPEELKTLLKEANSSTAPNAFEKVNKYLVDNAWAAPLSYNVSNYAYSKGVNYKAPAVWGDSLLPWSPAQ
ncbi:ABC transporter substrate-binding protein [Paenarthrobacter sp. NPDC057981]|uniref:ABC transporter substrate-binding protein n=1 Tax=Paenarthrobacter sp. NPDC057981 TaxID=3346297 RepID=UPI0036DA73FE